MPLLRILTRTVLQSRAYSALQRGVNVQRRIGLPSRLARGLRSTRARDGRMTGSRTGNVRIKAGSNRGSGSRTHRPWEPKTTCSRNRLQSRPQVPLVPAGDLITNRSTAWAAAGAPVASLRPLFGCCEAGEGMPRVSMMAARRAEGQCRASCISWSGDPYDSNIDGRGDRRERC